MSIGKNKISGILVDLIQQNVEQELEHAKQSSNELETTKIREFKEKLSIEIDAYISDQLHDIRLEITASQSAVKWRRKKKLFKARNALVDSLFNDVKQDLIEFTRTNEYREYLVGCLTQCQQMGVLQHSTLYVMGRDMDLIRSLNTQTDIDVEEDPSINIGGLICINKDTSMEADFTLDSRLVQQTQWFSDHSKLFV